MSATAAAVTRKPPLRRILRVQLLAILLLLRALQGHFVVLVVAQKQTGPAWFFELPRGLLLLFQRTSVFDYGRSRRLWVESCGFAVGRKPIQEVRVVSTGF